MAPPLFCHTDCALKQQFSVASGVSLRLHRLDSLDTLRLQPVSVNKIHHLVTLFLEGGDDGVQVTLLQAEKVTAFIVLDRPHCDVNDLTNKVASSLQQELQRSLNISESETDRRNEALR